MINVGRALTKSSMKLMPPIFANHEPLPVFPRKIVKKEAILLS
jgi:hypothetical protein